MKLMMLAAFILSISAASARIGWIEGEMMRRFGRSTKKEDPDSGTWQVYETAKGKVKWRVEAMYVEGKVQAIRYAKLDTEDKPLALTDREIAELKEINGYFDPMGKRHQDLRKAATTAQEARIKRAQEKHQKELEKLQDGYVSDLEGLVAKYFVNNRRRYDNEKRDAANKYRSDVDKENKDFQNEMKKLDEQLAAELFKVDEKCCRVSLLSGLTPNRIGFAAKEYEAYLDKKRKAEGKVPETGISFAF